METRLPLGHTPADSEVFSFPEGQTDLTLRASSHGLELSPQFAPDAHVVQADEVAFSPDCVVCLSGVDEGGQRTLPPNLSCHHDFS